MPARRQDSRRTVPALTVPQWVKGWENVPFDAEHELGEPPHSYYLFSMAAAEIKALTGVYRRSTKERLARHLDPNVQRGHEERRSDVIREFVQFGFPWCEMSDSRRAQEGIEDLRKPGWLPTAVIVNILPKGAERNGKVIADEDLVVVKETSGGGAEIRMPSTFQDRRWRPSTIFPLEVIDGQHRLWAFEKYDPGKSFELPVVAFCGLERGWQAYLFWSVNITPKRINRSLAFDLYPLLRQQTWLDKFAGHSIYRETRAQELVESLWSHPDSPWQFRINMLGESVQERDYKGQVVSQAAWVRSLVASFVKQWEGTGTRVGGLYGAPAGRHRSHLPWNRAMQAAFLIRAWVHLRDAIAAHKSTWTKELRKEKEKELFSTDDPAFYGKHSLVTTDQGVRGYLAVVNDLFFVASDELKLNEWSWEAIEPDAKKWKKAKATDELAVSSALKTIRSQHFDSFCADIAESLAAYDWRTSSAPSLSEADRLKQAVFRGSSGYRELRKQLLTHLTTAGGRVAKYSKLVAKALKF